jgi:hypothetical protein
MTPRAGAILRRQFELSREKFGQDPGTRDPMFFDPSKVEPAQFSGHYIEDALKKAMRESGMPPQIIYAYKKTGLLLTKDSPTRLKGRLDATE